VCVGLFDLIISYGWIDTELKLLSIFIKHSVDVWQVSTKRKKLFFVVRSYACIEI
jgi:hypothetical protein